MPGATIRRWRSLSACLAWALVAGWLVHVHDARWIPHDEGTLAQAAERVLAGELPHRDFDDPYTGGLAWLQARTFALLGTRLVSLRIGLLALALAVLVPALLAFERRMTRGPALGAGLLVAVAWSLPCAFAALPSWYNLALAVLGAGLLVRRGEGGGRGWLVAVGALAGLSMAVKVTGLYAVAAAGVWILLEESRRARGGEGPRAALLGVHLAALGVLALALAKLLGSRLFAAEGLHFALPPLAVTGAALASEARARGALRARLGPLLRDLGALLAGVVVGLAPLVLVYMRAGALDSLWRGVVRAPMSRLTFASWSPPPLTSGLWALPLVALLAFAPALGARLKSVLALLSLALVVPLWLGDDARVYRAVWDAARLAPALLVCVAAVRYTREGWTPLRAALTTHAAFLGLLRFPFATPVYLLYVAPLAVLLGFELGRPLGPRLGGVWLVFLGLFGALWSSTGTLSDLGWGYFRQPALVPLELERAGLRVPRGEAEEYAALVAEVRARSRGAAILAGPDCPEVYFLAAKRNPTRRIFDFLGQAPEDDAELLGRLRAARVDVVVLNEGAAFSGAYSDELLTALRARFGDWRRFGRFLVGSGQ